MLTEEDIKWLNQKYPKLIVTPEEILGVFSITGTYNPATNRFLNIENNTIDDVGGLRLSGDFKIRIRERIDRTYSNLPELHIENVESEVDRHINVKDGSACLCSPFEESEFLLPQFQFRRFFEELVIPFLYGQLFYNEKRSWPWLDYGHGSVGLLESYIRLGDSITAQECIQKLSKDNVWPKIKLILSKKSEIKGHTDCFCPKKDRIRNHTEAWAGLRKLRTDVIKQELMLP